MRFQPWSGCWQTDKDPRAAAQAAHVLGSTAGAAACDPLTHAIADSKDNFVRESAVAAMGRLWPACPQTIPTLMGTFGGGFDSLRFPQSSSFAKLESLPCPR